MANKIYESYQEGLIKTLLARPESLSEVIEYIVPEDIENVSYRTVYQAMINLNLKQKDISLAAITLEVDEMGGGIDPAWLLSLDQNVAHWVTQATPETWAALVKKESTREQGRQVLSKSLKEIDNQEQSVLGLIEKTTTELTDVSINAVIERANNITDVVDNYLEETREIQEKGGQTKHISSPYPSIDHYTGGWGPGQLVTIGARTGVGKSVFAINTVVSAITQGQSVLFFSLEMTEREVLSRMFAQLSMIPIQTLEKGLPLSADESNRVKEAAEWMKDTKLTIETSASITVEMIKSKALRLSQSEVGLDMIVIDYLQLIQGSTKSNRQEAVAEVSRQMKVIAKELDIPVMVLVQLKRENRQDGEDQSPKIYDIRESGAIAQDSNIIILIDRKTDNYDDEIDPKATFILAKNRQGEAGKYITVRSMLECSLFLDDNTIGQKHTEALQVAAEYEENHQDEYADETAPIPERIDDLPGDFFGGLDIDDSWSDDDESFDFGDLEGL